MPLVLTPSAATYRLGQTLTSVAGSGLTPSVLHTLRVTGGAGPVDITTGTTDGSGNVTFSNVTIPAAAGPGAGSFFTITDDATDEENSDPFTLLAALSPPQRLGLKLGIGI